MSKAKDVVKTAINPFWSASEKGGKKATEAVAESMTPDMPNMDDGDQPVMPDADEATLMKNKKAAVARQRQRSGRASTILSSSGKLGG
jgi:hypothetical protein